MSLASRFLRALTPAAKRSQPERVEPAYLRDKVALTLAEQRPRVN